MDLQEDDHLQDLNALIAQVKDSELVVPYVHLDEGLTDQEFMAVRDTLPGIYIIQVVDENKHKQQVFRVVDACQDKICYITRKTIGLTQPDRQVRRYIYAKPTTAKELFKKPEVPLEELVRTNTVRDYFSVPRWLSTRTIYSKIDFLKCKFDFWSWLVTQPIKCKPFILLTGHSDYEVDDELVKKYSDYFANWFGVNNVSSDIRTTGLPLGLCNYSLITTSPEFLFDYTGENTKTHRNFGMDEFVTEMWQSPKTNNIMMLLNFSVYSHSSRQQVLDTFIGHPLAVNKSKFYERLDYLLDLRQARFCISPRGNGIDCHRFWEALYAGCVPIVEQSPVFRDFNGLPFISVDKLDGTHITNAMLTEASRQVDAGLACGRLNYHKLYISYWLELIERKSVALTEK